MTLWNQVNRLVWKYAHKWAALGRGGVTSEDLVQTGFAALMEAVDSYNPEKARFSTHLVTRLRAEFTEATGQRTTRKQLDPLHSALSMDVPLTDGDGDIELISTIPDPEAEAAFLDVERGELCAAVRTAVDALPERQRAAIRARYFGEGSVKWERQDVSRAMRSLRRDHARRLEGYL